MRKHRSSRSTKARSNERKFEYLFSILETHDTHPVYDEVDDDPYEDVDRDFSPFLHPSDSSPPPSAARVIWIPFIGTFTLTSSKKKRTIENDYDVDRE